MLAATLASTAADTALKKEREQREKVFSCNYICLYTTICVLIIVYMCLELLVYVSSYS